MELLFPIGRHLASGSDLSSPAISAISSFSCFTLPLPVFRISYPTPESKPLLGTVRVATVGNVRAVP
eukprot:749833-Hanusia_phi.AAC.2